MKGLIKPKNYEKEKIIIENNETNLNEIFEEYNNADMQEDGMVLAPNPTATDTSSKGISPVAVVTIVIAVVAVVVLAVWAIRRNK